MKACKIPVIDNTLYDEESTIWWSDDGIGAMLRYISSPWRLPYFRSVLERQSENLPGRCLLDVGCGGGILTEEFAGMGFEVTGLDPSERLLEVAREHATANGLNIDYQEGYGHKLPFEDQTFDIVACCDVLEHIKNWDAVIDEIARVLKNKGIFLFDTINRTVMSKIFLIKMAQQWKYTRFLPSLLHTWEMFIKPQELKNSLDRYGLHLIDVKGTKPANPISIMISAHRFNRGKLSVFDFARRLSPAEGPDLNGFYMGYALNDSSPLYGNRSGS